MAYFAKINENNVVIQVVSVSNNELLDSNGIEQESKGIEFLKNLYKDQNARWIQTSYNTINGKHRTLDPITGQSTLSNDQSKARRKNYAGIGMTYDENRDAFIPKKNYNSWIFNEFKCDWEAPIPYPQIDGQAFIWDEENINWTLIE
jgi:hypothetical protein